jgi:hypothetical protein
MPGYEIDTGRQILWNAPSGAFFVPGPKSPRFLFRKMLWLGYAIRLSHRSIAYVFDSQYCGTDPLFCGETNGDEIAVGHRRPRPEWIATLIDFDEIPVSNSARL